MKSIIRKIIIFIGKVTAIIFPVSIYQKVQYMINLFYTSWVSCLIKKSGKGIYIGRNINLLGGQYLEIGESVSIGKNAVITAWDKYEEQIFNPKIIIGDGCNIGEYCHISAINKIVFGENVLTGRWLTVVDNVHGKAVFDELTIPPVKRALYSKGSVIIEDNVWIGDKVTITSGLTIGKNAIIGANSVVTRNIPANCVACGNPARVVKYIGKCNIN